MRHTAEIGIVGAGPAGARAAELLAARGASVVILDPKVPWEKPCGGGLPPAAFDEIPEFEELKTLARAIGRVRIELSPEEGFSVGLDRPLWILSRRALGRWQLNRALEAGAIHLPVKVRSAQRSSGGWLVDTDDGTLRVAFLVGADGATSLVRHAAAPNFSVELAPTRVAYRPRAGPTPDTVILKLYPGIAGYLWDFPRPDHRSVGIGVSGSTWRRARLDGEIDAYWESSEPCSCPGLDRAGAVIGTAQHGHGDFSRIAGNDFALLGDAAGFADPLTGEGIQNALRSAALLAEAWEAGERNAYPSLARRTFAWEFRVARIVRQTACGSDVFLHLIRRGISSDIGYAVVEALVNGANEHDWSVLGLSRRWYRALRQIRANPSMARRTARIPVPCECSSTCEDIEGGACHEASAAA